VEGEDHGREPGSLQLFFRQAPCPANLHDENRAAEGGYPHFFYFSKAVPNFNRPANGARSANARSIRVSAAVRHENRTR
jgi:hypothetical protein